jgi:hypothetical protein
MDSPDLLSASFLSALGSSVSQSSDNSVYSYSRWLEGIRRTNIDVKTILEHISNNYPDFLSPEKYSNRESNILLLSLFHLSHETGIDTAISILKHGMIFTPPELAKRGINNDYITSIPNYLTHVLHSHEDMLYTIFSSIQTSTCRQDIKTVIVLLLVT